MKQDFEEEPFYCFGIVDLLYTYNMEMTFHSHACIFTRLWQVKILTDNFKMSPYCS